MVNPPFIQNVVFPALPVRIAIAGREPAPFSPLLRLDPSCLFLFGFYSGPVLPSRPLPLPPACTARFRREAYRAAAPLVLCKENSAHSLLVSLVAGLLPTARGFRLPSSDGREANL